MMHYYKRNLGDYAKKAGRLSMLQHGSYTLLIDACYDREQFPTKEEAIEWTWASSTAEIEAVEFVLRKFFVLEDGVYVQKRIQEELAEYHEKAETNKRIAIERETKRKEKSTNRAPDVNEAPPNHKPLTINHKPLTINQEPVTKNQEPSENQKPATATRLPTAKRKQSIPVDFKPTQKHYELAASLSVNLAEELPQFCDHHLANGSVMASWDAALSKWIRNAAKWGGKAGATKFLTAQQQRDENNRRSTAEFLADDTPFFGQEPEAIEGEFNHA